MSEYQYYEFLAIDRPLTAAEQAALRQISTRATITANSFTNTYHWGNLKADPRQMVEKYFDAHLYTFNSSTRQLLFRFPKRLLDLDTAREYCYTESTSEAWTKGRHTIVGLTYSAENYDDADWDDFETGEGRLGAIVGARSEVLEGDLRLLYLGWLFAADSGMLDDDEHEPSVPPGLGQLSGPLQSVAHFLAIDPHLLTAAAETSVAGEIETVDEAALKAWITALPTREKTQLLISAAQGKTPPTLAPNCVVDSEEPNWRRVWAPRMRRRRLPGRLGTC